MEVVLKVSVTSVKFFSQLWTSEQFYSGFDFFFVVSDVSAVGSNHGSSVALSYSILV